VTYGFALAYAAASSFILSSLARARREEREASAMLVYTSHGWAAASATGGCLALSLLAFGSFAHL
jgi:hypothetical protein